MKWGSALDFAKEIVNRSERQVSEMDIQDDLAEVKNKVQSGPRLIVTNIGQCFWPYNAGHPVTIWSWDVLPRQPVLCELAHSPHWTVEKVKPIRAMRPSRSNNSEVVMKTPA